MFMPNFFFSQDMTKIRFLFNMTLCFRYYFVKYKKTVILSNAYNEFI